MPESVNQLAKEFFAALMEAEPTWAHMLGDFSHADRFEDASRAAEDRHLAMLRGFADRVGAIDPAGLGDDEQATHGVLRHETTARADLTEARLEERGANPIFGLQASLPVITGMLGVPDESVAEAMVSKLHGVGQHFRDHAERQREGVARRRTSPAFAVRATIEQLDKALAVPASEDPVVAAVKLPDGVDAEAWRTRFAEAVEQAVRPGMERYRDVLRDEVLPTAPDDDHCGLSWLADGEDAYARTLRFFTTTGKSAGEIHEIGLAQVESLAEEYRRLGPDVVGTDDLEQILTALRTEPALHFETADQLVEQSKVALARAWDAMGDWFEVLPQAPCDVQGVTTGAKAYYFPPAADNSRGGSFFINVEDPDAWGLFELESLAFHEAIPGHHLQLAIANELPDSVPEIRKYSECAAYAEGWGLYSERLADEMGLYSSPTDRMGMLSADSLRACRLVVDTGIHALGWSRQQAIDYMVANSPMTERIVRPEVDRYICSPGQATSYMIGRLEIQRMRREAEQRQGASFDVRKFHSAVLDSGALPLGVLDEVVRRRLR
jgi:uncharacterized protein (DUF885 family)